MTKAFKVLPKNSIVPVLILLESFKTVIEKEKEAEKIILDAKAQAERLRKQAQKKGEEIYGEIFRGAIAQAKHRSIEIKEQARIDAERDAQIYLKRAEREKKQISKDTEEKFGEAVNTVLIEILT